MNTSATEDRALWALHLLLTPATPAVETGIATDIGVCWRSIRRWGHWETRPKSVMQCNALIDLARRRNVWREPTAAEIAGILKLSTLGTRAETAETENG